MNYFEKRKRELEYKFSNEIKQISGNRYFSEIDISRLAYYNHDIGMVAFDDYLIEKGIIKERNQLKTIIVEEQRIFDFKIHNYIQDSIQNSQKKEFFQKDGWNNYDIQHNIFYKTIGIIEPLTGKSIFVLGRDSSYDSFPKRSNQLLKVSPQECIFMYLSKVNIDSFAKVYKDVDIDKMVEALHTFIPLVNASLSKVNETERLKLCEENKMKANIEEIAHKYRLY